MYIILRTAKPNKTKISHNGQKAHYFCTEDLAEAKAFLDEVEDTDNTKYWSRYNISPDLACCREFNDYLKQLFLEPNKLSILEMQKLCIEAQQWFANFASKRTTYDICYSTPSRFYKSVYQNFRVIWEELVYIIDRYTQTNNNIPHWDIKDYDFNPAMDLGLKFHFEDIQILSKQSLCGTFNSKFYKLIYYFDFLGIKIKNPKLKEFWDFYKRTLNVYSIEYDKYDNRFNIIPKPDEILIKDEIMHYSYDSYYYCDGIKVEKWFYDSDSKDLKLSDFDKLTNVDVRSLFLKKAGIKKFIRRGEVIDSWENYPDNEWWAKSEYKLIDMKKIFFEKITTTPSGRVLSSKNYDYAPFLYMKNQTTGEYHLEGVSPDCKNLYDALKMRYKDLNLPVYEVKDIK